jgi:hypothetical protein
LKKGRVKAMRFENIEKVYDEIVSMDTEDKLDELVQWINNEERLVEEINDTIEYNKDIDDNEDECDIYEIEQAIDELYGNYIGNY